MTATLDRGQTTAMGWSATIDLSATDKTYDEAQASAGFIAARLGLPLTSVMVVPHDSGRHDLAKLMVFERNPLQQKQLFAAPTLDLATGYATVGRHTDGRPALWRFFVPGWGVCHGLIFGTTGAGKSGLLHVLFAEARHSGVICTLFGDPDGGESVPEYTEHVQVFSGSVPRIYEMLRGVERILEDRRRTRGRERWQDEQGRWHRGRGTFTPTREDPMLMVVLDEWPTIAADLVYGKECVRIAGQIGKRGRKFGIGLIVVTQIPSLDEMGKDAGAVRGMAAGMNVAAFRTADAQDKQMGLPMKLPIDPASLPERWPDGSLTAGLGFLARSDAAAMPMRGLFQEDPYSWARSGDPAPIPARLMQVGGPLFGSWREMLDVEEDDVVAVLPDGRLLMAGESPEPTEPSTAKPATSQPSGSAWDKLRPVLEAHPHGATTKVLSLDTGLNRKLISTTLRRYEAKGEAHEATTGGVWKLGPAPKPALQLVQ
jgi:hypothetical protein